MHACAHEPRSVTQEQLLSEEAPGNIEVVKFGPKGKIVEVLWMSSWLADKSRPDITLAFNRLQRRAAASGGRRREPCRQQLPGVKLLATSPILLFPLRTG